MINKELLSEVLGDEYKDRLVDWFQVEDNYLRTYYDCGKYDLQGRPTGLGIEINIYELANKCKEWANKKSYTVIDYIDINNDEFWTCRAYPNGLNDGFDYEAIYQPLSPISIFDVCQWILDNKKEGN